jgi:hypothetical protein
MSLEVANEMSCTTSDALAAVAARAPTVVRVRAFVDWVGAGRALTQTGRLRRADALALVELLDTRDVLDQRFPIQSSAELSVQTAFVRLAGRRPLPTRKSRSAARTFASAACFAVRGCCLAIGRCRVPRTRSCERVQQQAFARLVGFRDGIQQASGGSAVVVGARRSRVHPRS